MPSQYAKRKQTEKELADLKAAIGDTAPVQAYGRLSAAQTQAAATTIQLNWAVPSLIEGGIVTHSTGTPSRITIAKSGYYVALVRVMQDQEANDGNAYGFLRINKNGTQWSNLGVSGRTNATNPVVHVFKDGVLLEGDYLTVDAYSDRYPQTWSNYDVVHHEWRLIRIPTEEYP